MDVKKLGVGKPKKNGAIHSDFFKGIIRDKYLLLLLLPGVAVIFVFKYLPMGGLIIAFKNYSITKGIWDSPWAGLDIFRKVFSSSDFGNVLRNTLLISSYKILFGFPIPIILSLMLNEIRSTRFKRVVQTVIYLPHFISWVVISGIMLAILSPTYGVMGAIYEFFGQQPINLMATSKYFRFLLVISDSWKEMGWGTIIYMAALSTVDPTFYEAAIIDGAGKLKQMWYITLPCISSVIILLLILRIGNIMNAGFEQVLVLQNDAVRPVAEIFETFVYRRGLQRGDYSYSTAVGFFKSVVALIMIWGSDRFAKVIGEEGLL